MDAPTPVNVTLDDKNELHQQALARVRRLGFRGFLAAAPVSGRRWLPRPPGVERGCGGVWWVVLEPTVVSPAPALFRPGGFAPAGIPLVARTVLRVGGESIEGGSACWWASKGGLCKLILEMLSRMRSG